MKARLIIFVITSLSLTGCLVKAQTKKPAMVAATDQERFKLAADYSSQHSGNSVLVMKGDKIIFEDYENGTSADTASNLFSGTKSFSGAMLCAAIEDGLISGFDEKVSDTITEWKSDPQKSKITIRELLSLRSGITAGQLGRVPKYADAVSSPMKYEPGSHFEYGPVPYQTFGEIMTRKLKPKGETVMSYMKRRVFDPIGIKIAEWRTFDGQPLLPQGLSLTAREWVKYGLFLKNGGKWNGKQLIRKDLLAELTKGSEANPAYGMTVWLNKPAGKDPRGRMIGGNNDEIATVGFIEGVDDMFMAAGAFNQRLYIFPSLDMVVVRQQKPDLRGERSNRWSDREFLGRLLFGKV